MALGFRDCCNQYSYFLLDSTPSFVSEFETYHISTQQGLSFCGVYVNLPTLNYNPPVYVLSEMTQQVDCATCIQSFPCPMEEAILVNEFVSGSVAQGTDCQVVTIPPMFATCQSTNPTTYGAEDGSYSLVVSGGVAPYRFISAGTQIFLSYTQTAENTYTIFNGIPAGTYSVVVQDSNLDFSITGTCVLENPPSVLDIQYIVTPATFYNKPDGKVEFVLNNGIPPYIIKQNGEEVGLIIENLVGGIYFFEISDQVSSQIITVEVTQPDLINYTPGICFTFSFCGTIFNLNFVKLSVFENLRPRYRCTNPTKIGLKEIFIRWSNEEPAGWETTIETPQTDDIQFEVFPGNCNFGDGTFFATGPSTEQPTGSWVGGGMIQGLSPIATPGGCPPTVIVREPIGTYCPGPPISLAEVILEGAGGSGGPYTFYYSTNGVNYLESSVGTLYLTNGTYSAKVKDSDGIISLPVNFTVVTEVNLFRGDQVGFCGIVEPESVGVTGVLDRAINPGEQREIDVTLSHYFDFSTLPEGTVFTGKFYIYVTYTYYGADDGFNNPLDSAIFLYDLKDAYYVQNGTRVDFLNTVQNTVGLFPSGDDILGSSTLYTENYGVFNPGYSTDSCTASTINPSRTSPNYWFSCENLIGNASLIEGDRRGLSWNNSMSFKTNQVATYNQQTRLAIKFRIRMVSKMPPYIPLILNETDATTLLPAFYVTPEGFSGEPQLNIPNEFNNRVGGTVQFYINYGVSDLTLTQSPPGVRCFSLQPTLSSLGKYTVPGQTYTATRLNFQIDTGASATQPGGAREVIRYNDTFYPNNNTCSERPPWAS